MKTSLSIPELLKLLGLLALVGCGGANDFSETGDVGGGVALMVKGAQQQEGLPSHARIDSFLVTISGSDMERPIVAAFSGDAVTGVIVGIPIGDDRLVSVEAINPFEKTIRAGERGEVRITSGDVTQVEVSLESVPIFVNLKERNVIDNTRLVFHLYSDSDDLLEILDEQEGNVHALITPAVVTGFDRISTPPLTIGEHRFMVRSLKSGRSSAVTAKLLDGSRRRGAPLASAATVQTSLIAILGGSHGISFEKR